jgi:hypothetical protein
MRKEIRQTQVHLFHFLFISCRRQAEVYQQVTKQATEGVSKQFLARASDLRDDAILKNEAEVKNIAIIQLPVSLLIILIISCVGVLFWLNFFYLTK